MDVDYDIDKMVVVDLVVDVVVVDVVDVVVVDVAVFDVDAGRGDLDSRH